GKRLVCPDLRVPKQGGRVRRLGAEDRRHLRKSPNPRGAQRLGRPAKAKHVKRAALVGCDRPNRVAVAKPEAAARHRGERSAVGRNRVRVAPRKSAIKRELETNALLGPQESGQGWIRTSEGVKPADLQSAPFGHFGTYPFASNPYRMALNRLQVVTCVRAICHPERKQGSHLSCVDHTKEVQRSSMRMCAPSSSARFETTQPHTLPVKFGDFIDYETLRVST